MVREGTPLQKREKRTTMLALDMHSLARASLYGALPTINPHEAGKETSF
jgi:hypothetical protein